MLNDNVYIVYKTTNLLNGMIYVGVYINETVNLVGRGGNMIRYHFDNCKENINAK